MATNHIETPPAFLHTLPYHCKGTDNMVAKFTHFQRPDHHPKWLMIPLRHTAKHHGFASLHHCNNALMSYPLKFHGHSTRAMVFFCSLRPALLEWLSAVRYTRITTQANKFPCNPSSCSSDIWCHSV